MSQKKYFNNINDLDSGIKRELAEGVSTRIFCGEQAMLSLVDIEPKTGACKQILRISLRAKQIEELPA